MLGSVHPLPQCKHLALPLLRFACMHTHADAHTFNMRPGQFLFFVSARTNERHHHHHTQTNSHVYLHGRGRGSGEGRRTGRGEVRGLMSLPPPSLGGGRDFVLASESFPWRERDRARLPTAATVSGCLAPSTRFLTASTSRCIFSASVRPHLAPRHAHADWMVSGACPSK
jgi:hypothetical protein